MGRPEKRHLSKGVFLKKEKKNTQNPKGGREGSAEVFDGGGWARGGGGTGGAIRYEGNEREEGR